MATVVKKTIGPGKDYETLAAWEAAMRCNCVALDQIHEAECYAMNDTTPVVLNTGWTTDATRYVRIYAAAGNGHSGYWNDSKYTLSVTDAIGLSSFLNFIR